jgi:AcrR family transcriptional regulator
MSPVPAFQRARTPDERAHREREILAAAAALFDAEGLEGVTLNAVARKAGVAKSNIYRYFESREAILLTLLNEDQAAAVSSLEERLAPLGAIPPRAVARVLAEVVAGTPRFCILQSAVSSVLEQNISEEGIAGYKRSVIRLGVRLGNALRSALPSLPAQAVGPFLRYLHVVIAGLYPLAHPSAAATLALRDPQFAVLKSDFTQDLEAMLAALLGSLCANGGRPAAVRSV